MRIGIDLTHAYQRQGGIPRYAVELARALLKIDQDNEYVWFFRGEPRPELMDLSAKMHVSPVRHQVLCEQIWLYRAARQARVDVLHLTGFAGPLAYGGAAVATLMDMTQFLYPETMKFKQALYWRWLFPLSLKRKKAIVTISNHSRQDASRLLGIPLEKITSIPLACSSEFLQEKSQSQLREAARRVFDAAVETAYGGKVHLPFGPLAEASLRRLDAMTTVGDLAVISALDAETGEVAAFEELVGSHGGVGGAQTQGFVLYPSTFTEPGGSVVGAPALHGVLIGWLEELGLRGSAVAQAAAGGPATDA